MRQLPFRPLLHASGRAHLQRPVSRCSLADIRPRVAAWGFTLLEMLLTVALVSLALGLTLNVANRSTEIWRSRQEAASAARSAWTLVHRIGRELRMALPPDQHGPEAALRGQRGESSLIHSLPGAADDGAFAPEMVEITLGDDRIRFAAWPFGEADSPIAVEYAILRDPDEGALGVGRRSSPLLGEPIEEIEAVLVAQDVASLSFEYLDGEGEWRREWDDESRLPRAVRVRAGVFTKDVGPMPELQEFFTTVYLPAGARIGP